MHTDEKGMVAKSVSVLAKAAELVMLFLMVSMVCLVTYQVFERYVLHYTPPWSEELAVYLMIWFGIIGIAVGVRLDSHMALHYFADKMPAPVQKFIAYLKYILILIYVGVLTYQGIQMVALTMTQKSPAMGLPIGLVYSSLPVATILIGIFILEKLFGEIRKGRMG